MLFTAEREAVTRPPGSPLETQPVENGNIFGLLFLSHPVPTWVYDLDTLAFLEVNDAAVLEYGYPREEFF